MSLLTRKRFSRLSLTCVIFLVALNFLKPGGVALADLSVDPPTYDDPPPGPAFNQVTTNLPTGPLHQKFGIAAHPWWLSDYLDQFIADYKDLKITTVRLPVEWKILEPSQGVYNWEVNDRLLDRLNDEGFEVVAEFVTVPVWASANPTECAKSDIDCDPDARYTGEMQKMAQELVKRYPFVRYWEFWNEPDQWPHMGNNDIGKYAKWLKAFYDGAKSVDPTIEIAVTSLSGPAYVEWLYNYSDIVFGMRPWDAVAYHPYQTAKPDPNQIPMLTMRKNRVDQLRQLMVDKGDGNKPIWLTEIGWENSPQNQSIFLKNTFDWLAKRPFITIATVHMLHDWQLEAFGLMAVKGNDVFNQRPLNKNDQFVPKQPYYDTYKNYEKRPLPPQPAATDNMLVFGQTGHTVRDAFKRAWEQGGLALFGYAETGQFYERNPSDGHYYLVQYFERVRMEYHPENIGTPYEVLFGLLGTQLLTRKGDFNAAGQPLNSQVQPEIKPAQLANNESWFGETGHLVSGLFLVAWQQHGGLSVIGLPVSQVFEERNPDDGQTYQVQYFQRARAELHPGKNGQPPLVLFGLLGNEVLRSQGRLLPNNGVDFSNYYNPALPEFRMT